MVILLFAVFGSPPVSSEDDSEVTFRHGRKEKEKEKEKEEDTLLWEPEKTQNETEKVREERKGNISSEDLINYLAGMNICLLCHFFSQYLFQ